MDADRPPLLPVPLPAELMSRARLAAENAYARYSDFPVGAAVVDEHGRIFTGVNVENASYGLTICAERVAIFTAIAAGAKAIAGLAVSASRAHSISPCGACRQVLKEFASEDTPVWCDDHTDFPTLYTAGQLLPAAFGPSDLKPPMLCE